MSGKKRRKDDPDCDSDSNLAAEFDSPMDSDSLAADPRSSVTSDLGSRPATAPGNDPRPSTSHARNIDPRTNLTTAGSSVGDDEPHLQPDGSYLIIKPRDEGVSFRKINVFWPTKYFRSICGAENLDIETPANGSLVVKTQTRAQTKKLLQCTSFCEKSVTVSLHPSRNSTKGTVFAPEMRFMSEDEILDGLKCEGVSHVRRLTTFRDGQRKDTNLLVITFETTTLPDSLLAGHIRYPVRVFIPNHLRCFNCQRFGHSSKFCKQNARCPKCGEAPHDGSVCSAPLKCLSCNSSDHLANSNQCPVWKREKEICAVKATNGVSYREARRTVEEKMPNPAEKTYAQAAKLQTATTQTQTDPLPQLPPLKLLAPIAAESTAVSSQTAESAAPTPAPVQACHRPTPHADTPRPGATARPGAWQVAGGRAKVRPPGTGQPVPALPRPLSPTRGRPERQSRPAIKVSGGRCRSSQSVGRFPSGGGNSSFS